MTKKNVVHAVRGRLKIQQKKSQNEAERDPSGKSCDATTNN